MLANKAMQRTVLRPAADCHPLVRWEGAGLQESVRQWLLHSNPWTAFNFKRDAGLFHDTESAREGRLAIAQHPLVAGMLDECREYFPIVATRHDDPKLSHYKLRLLVDFGLTQEDGLSGIVEQVLAHNKDGLFAIRQQIPVRGADEGEWNALPCDNPVILYTLLKLGLKHASIDRQVDLLKQRWSDRSGWFCHLSFVESQFKREGSGCPMAALQALEVFRLTDGDVVNGYIENAFHALRYHYESRRSLYYFGRGKRFFTFKYPFVWYNAFYVADVVSRFRAFQDEPLVLQLMDWIRAGSDASGRYTPTSIFMPYKHFDFGNKREPSPWITYCAYRILDAHAGGPRSACTRRASPADDVQRSAGGRP
jgi:hypothetical protein